METNPPKEWWDEELTITPQQLAQALQGDSPLPITNRYVMELVARLKGEPVPA